MGKKSNCWIEYALFDFAIYSIYNSMCDADKWFVYSSLWALLMTELA